MSYSRCRSVIRVTVLLLIAVVLFPATAGAAIVFGQVDDFQIDRMNWSEGESSSNAPGTAPGGPDGPADLYLRNVSSGTFSGGSRQVMFNQAQWAGDYNAAGVNRISGWVANFGSTPLHLRVTLSSSFNQFSSTNSFDLPADGVWRRVRFDLTDSALTRIGGTATLSTALSSVTELRLLSAAAGPNFRGDVIASTLGIDDLRAMRPEGDANFDGRVDGADFQVVRSNLGSAGPRTWREGDFNFDGRVNAMDVALLRRNLTRPSAAAAVATGVSVVPEPGCGLLFALSSTVLLTRRRRHAR